MNLVVYLFIYFCCMRFKKKHYFWLVSLKKRLYTKEKEEKELLMKSQTSFYDFKQIK